MVSTILGAVEGVPSIAIAIVVVLILAILVFVLLKGRGDSEPASRPKADRPEGDDAKPKTNLLEDRMEVESPVEVTDDMSLAEIRRAKAARVVGKDKRRETAVEATEKSRRDHQEDDEEDDVEEADESGESVEAEATADTLDDVSAGWSEMLSEVEEDEASADADAEVAEPEVAEPEIAEPEVDEADEAQVDEPEVDESRDAEPEVAEPEAAEPEAAEPDDDEAEVAEPEVDEAAAAEPAVADLEEQPKSLEKGLEKTRKGFISRLGELFKGDSLDDELVEEVEEVLFTADIGPHAAQDILDALDEHLKSSDKEDPAKIWSFIRSYVLEILEAREERLDVDQAKPFVMLVVGVNGVGKTTTIGKMASRFKREGKSVLMVAGDTFRAAAVEQLGVWGERTGIPVFEGESEADPSSVIYGGIEKGVADGVDVILCDTAGRLHTKSNLLDELSKMGRVASKVIDDAPHETILVLDANTGQNAIQQAKFFKEAVDISGIVLTKLDGTAKGGVILGICEELDAPIRYIGIGEGVRDLRPFDAAEFVEALFM